MRLGWLLKTGILAIATAMPTTIWAQSGGSTAQVAEVTEYRIAEIFLSATPETAAETRANMARIVEQLRGGASFAAYSRQYSEATTAAIGGDLGWMRLEQLPAELAAALREMPVGSISDPIALPGGYSIVALADKRQTSP